MKWMQQHDLVVTIPASQLRTLSNRSQWPEGNRKHYHQDSHSNSRESSRIPMNLLKQHDLKTTIPARRSRRYLKNSITHSSGPRNAGNSETLLICKMGSGASRTRDYSLRKWSRITRGVQRSGRHSRQRPCVFDRRRRRYRARGCLLARRLGECGRPPQRPSWRLPMG